MNRNRYGWNRSWAISIYCPGMRLEEVRELWKIPVRTVETRSLLNTLYVHHLWPLTHLNIRFKLGRYFSRNDLLLFHADAIECYTDCEVFICTGFSSPGSTTKGFWGEGSICTPNGTLCLIQSRNAEEQRRLSVRSNIRWAPQQVGPFRQSACHNAENRFV